MRTAPCLAIIIIAATVAPARIAFAQDSQLKSSDAPVGQPGEDGGDEADPAPPQETPADTRSVDEIYRAVFGKDRPALGSDSYVVRLNGVHVGSYDIQPPPPGQDDGWVEGSFVDTMILPSVVAELAPRIRDLGGRDRVTFAALRDLGLDVQFDQQKLVLEVILPPDLRTRQIINLRALAKSGSVEYVRQADISGYLNLRLGADILADSETRATGIDRVAIDLEGALRVGPIVIEGAIDYDDRRSSKRWRRDDLLISYDDRNSLMRYELGDLSIGKRPYQGSPRMAGIAAYRKFSINPYLNTRPVAGREFELEQGGRVEVIVNGLPLRTIDLPSGRYRLQDFPLIPSAANDIRLLITYPSGRTEELIFPAFYDFELLEKGRTDFGMNLGVPYRVQNGEREYDTNSFNMLGYYRKGVTDTLTLGASIEGNEDFSNIGLEATWASPIGTFSFNLANDVRNPGPKSGQAVLQYRWRDADRERDRSIDGYFLLSGEDYRTLDQLFGESFVESQARVRVGQHIGGGFRAQLYGGYETYHGDQPDTYSISGSLSGSVGRFQVGGSLEYRHSSDRNEVIGQVSVSMRFGRTSITGNYSTDDNTARAQFTRTSPYAIGALSLGGTLERSDRSDRQSLRVGYVGNSFEAGVEQRAHNYLTPSADSSLSTELRFGTAMVFADGKFALSRPVSNSFAIFDGADEAMPDFAVDPQTRLGGVDKAYLAKSGGLGPAVVNNITPYYNRRIKVDPVERDSVANLSADIFALNADYRSGYFISLEADGSVAMVGNLVDRDGNPVALATGTYRVAGEQGDETQDFFTNRTGRFFLEGLEPGQTIEIRLADSGVPPVLIEVQADAAGLVTLDQPIALSIDYSATSSEQGQIQE